MRLTQIGLTPTRLMMIAAGFISVYFGFSIAGNWVHQYQLEHENSRLEQQIAAQQGRYERLKALRDWMQSNTFVEAAARQQGMVKPGDRPIAVIAPSASPAPDDGREWWERYFEP
jgi:cell division protein FtsB